MQFVFFFLESTYTIWFNILYACIFYRMSMYAYVRLYPVVRISARVVWNWKWHEWTRGASMLINTAVYMLACHMACDAHKHDLKCYASSLFSSILYAHLLGSTANIALLLTCCPSHASCVGRLFGSNIGRYGNLKRLLYWHGNWLEWIAISLQILWLHMDTCSLFLCHLMLQVWKGFAVDLAVAWELAVAKCHHLNWEYLCSIRFHLVEQKMC